MPRHRSRRYRFVHDSESSVSSSCNSAGEEDASSSGSDSDSSSSEEESREYYSEKESDVECATRNQHNHYRENDSFSSSDDESVSNSSLEDDDDNNDEGNSDDENDSVKEADGSAKQIYLEEKRRGSVLKEKIHEHVPLLRAMAVGLKDDVRQDERFKSCIDNGFVKKKDVEMLKRHLYTEAKRRSSSSLKALSSWTVSELIDHLKNKKNRVDEKDEEKKLDKAALYFHPMLKNGRKAIGDSGYCSRDLSNKIVTTRWIHSKTFKKWIARVKCRQESLFIRMKAFQVLGGVFRHSKGGTDAKITLHKACTEAVLTLIAYDLEDYPLFDVDRSDVSR